MDFVSLFILVGCTFGPAAVVLIIYSIQRKRRSKIPRQRITKGIKSRRREDES